MKNKYDHAQLYDKLNNVSIDVSSRDCTCDICQSAKEKGHTKKPSGPKNKKRKPVTLNLCSICKGNRKRGVSHKCNKTQTYKNIQELLSPKSQELVSSTFMKKMSESERCKSESLSIRARTRSMNVTVPGIRKIDPPKTQISHQTLLDMQAKCNLSDIATLNIARDIRQGGGDVEPNFKPALLNRGKLLSDFVEPKVIPWCMKEKDSDVVLNISMQSVLCRDTKGFANYIC